MDSNSLSKGKRFVGEADKASKGQKGGNNSDESTRDPDSKIRFRKGKKFKGPRDTGIIYIGRIPHGFYEDQMRDYFNQFGKVITTCVARSKKTGRSRGFGYVEFKDQEVAKIAAETMNNYLMYNKILVCRYIPPEEREKNIYPGTISTSNYPRQKNRLISLRNNNKSLSKLTQETYLDKVQIKVNQFKRFFEARGIDFSFNINKKNPEPPLNAEEPANKIKPPCNEPVESGCQDDSENQLGVLEIDESDNDISFKTPPQVKKVIKRSSSSPAMPLKRSLIKKAEKTNPSKKKKTSTVLQKEEFNVKLKNEKHLDKKVKLKVKTDPKKKNNTMTKKKNVNVKKLFDQRDSKKQKLLKKKSSQLDTNKKAYRKIQSNTKKIPL